MPTNDFKCAEGHILADVFYRVSEAPKFKKCPVCGQRAYPTWKKTFNAKRSLTDILGNDGKFHPQFGYDIEIESADHYRQLCKEYEMEEADDAVGGNRDWRTERLERDRERAKRKRQFADVATDEQVREALGNV